MLTDTPMNGIHAAPADGRPRVESLLFSAGLITAEQLGELAHEHANTGLPMAEIAVGRGIVDADTLAHLLAGGGVPSPAAGPAPAPAVDFAPVADPAPVPDPAPAAEPAPAAAPAPVEVEAHAQDVGGGVVVPLTVAGPAPVAPAPVAAVQAPPPPPAVAEVPAAPVAETAPAEAPVGVETPVTAAPAVEPVVPVRPPTSPEPELRPVAAVEAPTPVADARHAVGYVVTARLSSGHALEVGCYSDEAAAFEVSRALVADLSDGREWLQVGATFVRPAEVISLELGARLVGGR